MVELEPIDAIPETAKYIDGERTIWYGDDVLQTVSFPRFANVKVYATLETKYVLVAETSNLFQLNEQTKVVEPGVYKVKYD
jgi:hypothetical protein